jgi:hypothetical protein
MNGYNYWRKKIGEQRQAYLREWPFAFNAIALDPVTEVPELLVAFPKLRDEVLEWLDENIEMYDYSLVFHIVGFKNENDALKFKMFWL